MVRYTTHVQPSLIEIEMIMLFANTFQSFYYEHLMGSSAQNFYEAMRIAERTMQAIKMRNIGRPTRGSKTITRDES
jgi:hypothetical protein